MRIGTIQSLWRYPVKSMLGEQLSSTSLGVLGFPGDRGYAIRDERAGEIRGARYSATVPVLCSLPCHTFGYSYSPR